LSSRLNAFARSNRFSTLKDAIRILAAAPPAVPAEAKPLALHEVKPRFPEAWLHGDRFGGLGRRGVAPGRRSMAPRATRTMKYELSAWAVEGVFGANGATN
jgi:hypothetical protein